MKIISIVLIVMVALLTAFLMCDDWLFDLDISVNHALCVVNFALMLGWYACGLCRVIKSGRKKTVEMLKLHLVRVPLFAVCWVAYVAVLLLWVSRYRGFFDGVF